MMFAVLFALYAVFDVSVRAFGYGGDRVEAVGNARLAMDRMEREIRAAYPYDQTTNPPKRYLFLDQLNPTKAAVPTSTRLSFGNETTGDRKIGSSEVIGYYLSGHDLMRSKGGSVQTLLDSVATDGLRFTPCRSAEDCPPAVAVTDEAKTPPGRGSPQTYISGIVEGPDDSTLVARRAGDGAGADDHPRGRYRRNGGRTSDLRLRRPPGGGGRQQGGAGLPTGRSGGRGRRGPPRRRPEPVRLVLRRTPLGRRGRQFRLRHRRARCRVFQGHFRGPVRRDEAQDRGRLQRRGRQAEAPGVAGTVRVGVATAEGAGDPRE